MNTLSIKIIKKCGFKIRIRFAYIPYSNLGLKFVHYFHLVKIGNVYNK